MPSVFPNECGPHNVRAAFLLQPEKPPTYLSSGNTPMVVGEITEQQRIERVRRRSRLLSLLVLFLLLRVVRFFLSVGLGFGLPAALVPVSAAVLRSFTF